MEFRLNALSESLYLSSSTVADLKQDLKSQLASTQAQLGSESTLRSSLESNLSLKSAENISLESKLSDI
jgi:hypothetical protein